MKYMNNLQKANLNSDEQLAFLAYLNQSLENGFSLNASVELMPILWPQKTKLMTKISQAMKHGAKFSDQLLMLGFSKTTVTQINMAFQQGNLVACLKQLTILKRLKNEQTKKLKAELSYPFVLLVMMILLLVFMQTFVSNQFTQTNEHSGDYLLMSLILGVILVFFYFIRIIVLLKKQDYQSMKTLIHYPIIGKAIRSYASYLLVYDIGLLLYSGFSLQKMCEYAQKQEIGSLQQYMGEKIGNQLILGKKITEIIKSEPLLPDSLLILLQTGAKRKNLSNCFLILGESLFNDLTLEIEKLIVNIQPICFIAIGLCVIGMYMKLLLPMYAMMQGV